MSDCIASRCEEVLGSLFSQLLQETLNHTDGLQHPLQTAMRLVNNKMKFKPMSGSDSPLALASHGFASPQYRYPPRQDNEVAEVGHHLVTNCLKGSLTVSELGASEDIRSW